MQKKGVYVIGFYFPVVPKGKARIRVQLSAGHSKSELDKAISAFEKVGKNLNVIKWIPPLLNNQLSLILILKTLY